MSTKLRKKQETQSEHKKCLGFFSSEGGQTQQQSAQGVCEVSVLRDTQNLTGQGPVQAHCG